MPPGTLRGKLLDLLAALRATGKVFLHPTRLASGQFIVEQPSQRGMVVVLMLACNHGSVTQ
jgi:hypothetical protein